MSPPDFCAPAGLTPTATRVPATIALDASTVPKRVQPRVRRVRWCTTRFPLLFLAVPRQAGYSCLEIYLAVTPTSGRSAAFRPGRGRGSLPCERGRRRVAAGDAVVSHPDRGAGVAGESLGRTRWPAREHRRHAGRGRLPGRRLRGARPPPA